MYRPPYKPWEEEIIRAYYPAGGVKACMARLPPHRTSDGIRRFANRNGIETTDEMRNMQLAEARNKYHEGDGYVAPQPRYPSVWHYAQGITA